LHIDPFWIWVSKITGIKKDLHPKDESHYFAVPPLFTDSSRSLPYGLPSQSCPVSGTSGNPFPGFLLQDVFNKASPFFSPHRSSLYTSPYLLVPFIADV